MDIHPELYSLFRTGSRTYFFSSVFFPRELRKEVFVLYAFVRKADNFVDCIPQDKEGFLRFRRLYDECLITGHSSDIVVESFVNLMARRRFDPAWVSAFLDAMEADLSISTYRTLEQVENYMYGSAEVVGLMMSAIFELKPEAYNAARLLGRAMQYINFIRDIEEDAALGRTYLPLDHAEPFGLSQLCETSARANPQGFCGFIRAEISRYNAWQALAENGFQFMPLRMRIPVATASEMYRWTGRQIAKDPLIVFKKKVKPGVPRIVLQAGQQFLTCISRTSPSIS